jgi:hypothetical protein
MSEITGKAQAGTFQVDGTDIFGELTVDGTNRYFDYETKRHSTSGRLVTIVSSAHSTI